MLPLQGFWNALVYVVTSRTACGNLWREMVGRGGSAGGDEGGGGMGLGELRGGKKGEGKLDRFTSRRASRRLESDDSSVVSLRGH